MVPPKVVCPRCATRLKLGGSIAAGRKVKCPRCGTPFIIGAGPSPGPEALPPRAGGKRLAALLAGILILLGGGAALVYFCYFRDNPDDDKEEVQKEPDRDKREVGKDLAGKVRRPPVIPPRKPLIQLSSDQQAQADRAVARGLAYLRSVQNPDGTWTARGENIGNNTAGVTALVGLTLLECGVKKDDPAVRKAAAYLHGREGPAGKLDRTYDIALALLFFDTLGDPADKELMPTLALRLVAGQSVSGGWGYVCPVLADADGRALAALLDQTKGQISAKAMAAKLTLKRVDPSKLRLDGGAAVPAALAQLAVWQKDVTVPPNDGTDNSNTQFAVLALWAAKSRGMPVQRALVRVVQRFHKTQNPGGTWGYNLVAGGPFGNSRVVGEVSNPAPLAMTCAGLIGLAVGQGLVNEARGQGGAARKPAAKQDPAIQRGLNFLAKQIANPHRPWQNASGAPLVNMYFMWSLERVGVIYGLPKIGGKDWYGWGAEKLIANQVVAGANGSWPHGLYYDTFPTVNTCFGLLFLKQANLAKDLTSKLVLEE